MGRPMVLRGLFAEIGGADDGGGGPIGVDDALAEILVDAGMRPIAGCCRMAVFDGVVVELRHMIFKIAFKIPVIPDPVFHSSPQRLYRNGGSAAKSLAHPFPPGWHCAFPARARP